MSLFKGLFNSLAVHHFAEDGGGSPAPEPAKTMEGSQPAEGQPAVAEPKAGSGQQDAEPVKDANTDWSKDPRHEKMWKKDPNGLYKSYTELEKVYNPLKENYGKLDAQFKSVAKILEDNGFKPTTDDITNIIQELKTLKDPENTVNKRNQFLSYWLDDSVKFNKYGQKIDSFFKDLWNADMQEQYPGWTSEQIAAKQAQDKRLQDLEVKEKERQFQTEYETETKNLQNVMGELDKFSKDTGFELTNDIKKELFQQLIKTGQSSSFLFANFIQKYRNEVMKKYSEKIKQDQLKTLQSNKDGGILPVGANKPAIKAPSKFDFKESAKKLFT